MNAKPLLLASGLLLCATAARAHAHLKSSSPAKDATLAAPPTEVVARFSEALELKMCRLTVTDAATGAVVSVGAPANDGKDPASLRIGLAALPKADARYVVSWKAVATDSHTSRGTFGFAVAAGKASP